MLPQLVDMHRHHDRETIRRAWLLARAVIDDQSKQGSASRQEGGELAYGRRKTMPIKRFHFNQYRPEKTLCARDKCRRIDAVTTTCDSLGFDLGTAYLQKTKHLVLQALLASAGRFSR
jgi:hypothetical protein